MKGNVSLSSIRSAPGSRPGADYAPRRVLAVLLALALCFGLALPASAEVAQTSTNKVSMTYEELSKALKPYSKDETILYRVTLKNEGSDIVQTSTGKYLKLTVKNTDGGPRFDIRDDIEYSGMSNPNHAPIKEYPSSGGSANEFKIQGDTGDILFAAGETISFTLEYTVTGSEGVATAINNELTLHAPKDSSHIWEGTVTADFSTGDNQTDVTVTYHSNFGTDIATHQQTVKAAVGQDAEFTVEGYPADYPKQEDNTFIGWGTKAGATTVAYRAGSTFKSDHNTDLYAVWRTVASSGTAPKIIYHKSADEQDTKWEDNSGEKNSDDGTYTFTVKDTRDDTIKDWSSTEGKFLAGWSTSSTPVNKSSWTYADIDYFAKDAQIEFLGVASKEDKATWRTTVTVTEDLDLYGVWLYGAFGYTLTIPDADLTDLHTEYGDLYYYDVTKAKGAKKYFAALAPNGGFAKDAEVVVDVKDPATTRKNTVFVAWYNKDSLPYKKESNETKGTADTFAFLRGNPDKSTKIKFKDTNTFHSLDAVWATMKVDSASFYYDGTEHTLNKNAAPALEFLTLGTSDDKPTAQRNTELKSSVAITFKVSAKDSGGNQVAFAGDETELTLDTEATETDGLVTYKAKNALPGQEEAGTYTYTITPTVKIYNVTVDESSDYTVSRNGDSIDTYPLTSVTATLTILPRPVEVTGSVETTSTGADQTAAYNETAAAAATLTATNMTFEKAATGGNLQENIRGLIGSDTLNFTATITGSAVETYAVTFDTDNDEITTTANVDDDHHTLRWSNANYTVEPNLTLVINAAPKPTEEPGGSGGEPGGTGGKPAGPNPPPGGSTDPNPPSNGPAAAEADPAAAASTAPPAIHAAARVPRTGDTALWGLFLTLGIGSAAGLCTALGFYLYRRRER